MAPAVSLGLIGFGEAAQAFVEGMGERRPSRSRMYDLKLDGGAGAAKRADAAQYGVEPCGSTAAVAAASNLLFSLVTAAEALNAAQAAAEHLTDRALYFDGNSVAPQTKRAAAALIEQAGGRYVDMAIMSPVRPALTTAPILLSGPHAEAGAQALCDLGFSKVTVHQGEVGAASAIKMIRSVMIKGIEALTAECLLAATAAGVDREVLASLDASEKPRPWAERGDYNLDRMMVHGGRRAEEMVEVVATLEALGVAPLMSRGTVAWQSAIGAANQKAPRDGYAEKIAQLGPGVKNPRA